MKKTQRFSTNAKTNKVRRSIAEHMRTMYNDRREMLRELERYQKEFKYIIDYNYIDYGNLLIYYTDIRKLYKGIKSVSRLSNDWLLRRYKYDTRIVINKLLGL